MNILDLIQAVGWPIALIVFFVWRDWKREASLTTRINKLEQYQQGKLEELCVKSIDTMNRLYIGFSTVADLLRTLTTEVSRMPCISKHLIEKQGEVNKKLTKIECELDGKHTKTG